MKRYILLNIVDVKSSTVVQLLPSKDKSLLVRWNSFFVLDLQFHTFGRIAGFDIQSDCFTRQYFHKDLKWILNFVIWFITLVELSTRPFLIAVIEYTFAELFISQIKVTHALSPDMAVYKSISKFRRELKLILDICLSWLLI